MALFEEISSTWEKRFMQQHYSYRDSHSADTVLFTEIPLVPPITPEQQELALLVTEAAAGVPGTVYYPFGYNARNNALTGSIFRWPNVGDYASGTQAPRGQCYARNVMIYVTEDTWIRFLSLNPIYLTLVAQGFAVAQIAAMNVPNVITEVEQFIGTGSLVTFDPTYGISIVFRADTVEGMIYISVEGNVEGGE